MTSPSALHNSAIIQRLYGSLQAGDSGGFTDLYHPDASFEDPVFSLRGKEIEAMWSMFCSGDGEVRVEYEVVEVGEGTGRVHWEAFYDFPATERPVHNVIDAEFSFRDGLIVSHRDTFDFAAWARQALGLTGLVLGRTSWLRRKVGRRATNVLERRMARRGG